jgi:chromosome segregation ATPase
MNEKGCFNCKIWRENAKIIWLFSILITSENTPTNSSRHDIIIRINRYNKGGENMENDMMSMLHTIHDQLGMINHRLETMDQRLETMDQRLETVDTRMEQLESRMEAMDQRMERLESRMERLESRMDQVEDRLDAIEIRVGTLESRFDQFDDRLTTVERKLDTVIEQTVGLLEFETKTTEQLTSFTNKFTTLELISAQNWQDITVLKAMHA